MQSVTNANFGPLIAYLVPGVTVLVGAGQLMPELRPWLALSAEQSPTIGGFLYLTVAAIAVGMVVSAVRWAVIDTIHAWTGLPLPSLDFGRLGENVDAFSLLIEIHYRHYQFYANMLVATLAAYACYRFQTPPPPSVGLLDGGVAALLMVFAAASRDTLAKYYRRSQQLLRSPRNVSAEERSQAVPRRRGATYRRDRGSSVAG